MTRFFLLSATLLGIFAAPAYAQNDVASTQSPPRPGTSASGTAQTLNSLPPGASTASRKHPGNDAVTTRFIPLAKGATQPALR